MVCVLSLFENAKDALKRIWHHRNLLKEINNACWVVGVLLVFVHSSDNSWTCMPSYCNMAEGWKLWRKNGYFIKFPTGWVGLVIAFTPPLKYENGSQTGNREFDNMLDRKLHPTVCVWVKNSTLLCHKKKQYRNRMKERLVALPAFPSCVFCACVCVLLAREDVDSRTAPIRIKASSIGGQRHALWVEIALPPLRKNIEKGSHCPIKTINVDKCQ